MPRIQQLPHSVITKIAAGEVIERPASVVKELLENSVDAGSSRIEVDVEQGGVELIRVVDDGCGIAEADLPLAFASHATSKLRCAEDLFHVETLGFRGEALASIGGVAQVALQSRPADQDRGSELNCHGGELGDIKPWNGAPGTRIEVRHLFFNTPVRRRFLKTIATELGHVSEMVTRLALAHPGLHLSLRHNGKMVFEVPASADLSERIGLSFGGEIKNKLYPVELSQGPVRLHGFIADPSCDRGSPKLQYLFLNGRWIRDRSLGHAIQEGYRGLLMTGRYAVVFLFLEMPPDLVDVNVHPTKIEVRFRDAQALYHLMLTAIRDRLRKENLTPRLQAPAYVPLPPLAAPLGKGGLPFPAPPARILPDPPASARPIEVAESVDEDEEEVQASEEVVIKPAGELAPPPSPPASTPTNFPRALQLHNAYLVLETEEGMLVIDQHALHERILFEQLKERLRDGELDRQQLLIPTPVDLPADQSARVLEHREALAELGLVIEEFGGGTLLVTCYPAILDRSEPAEILRAVVDHLAAHDRAPNRDQLFHEIMSLMACHAAVKAGDPLTPELVSELIAQRELAHDTHHCPHGRPTALLFSRHDLDKQFRRV